MHRLRANVSVVLLRWVRIRVNHRVLIEHVAIRVTFGKILEVVNLVFNLRLDSFVALAYVRLWQALL